MKFYRKINIPILVGIGELDESTPIESGRYLEHEMKKSGRNNLTFIEYKNADHQLLDSDGHEHLPVFLQRWKNTFLFKKHR